MHNKTLIADGSAAIIGSRNIGDDYYIMDAETLFLDYDALIIGEVVPDIIKSFDVY
jgi:putative cardiolipin synthase